MINTRKFMKRILTPVLFLIFISSANTFAQLNIDPMTKSSGTGDDMKSMIEKRASDLTSDLQSKVNLTDNQVSAVKSDLIDYMTKVSVIQTSQKAGLKEKSATDTLSDMSNSPDNSTSQDLKSADDDAALKIESVITADQKSKWSDIKDSWWNEVKSVAYNNGMRK